MSAINALNALKNHAAQSVVNVVNAIFDFPYLTWASRTLNRIDLLGSWSHLHRIRQAKRVISKIQAISLTPNGYAKSMAYLRKVNPYVFEELVLSCIEADNTRVIRNLAYSGDGGIDGCFKIKQGLVLVQCKRYSGHIQAKDVAKFSSDIRHHPSASKGVGVYGIFVHTGRTGSKSKIEVQSSCRIVMVSGSLLIDLILGRASIRSHFESTPYGATSIGAIRRPLDSSV